MISTIKLAARNLLRYRRRTLLTALLIMLGVMALLLFEGRCRFLQADHGRLDHRQHAWPPAGSP